MARWWETKAVPNSNHVIRGTFHSEYFLNATTLIYLRSMQIVWKAPSAAGAHAKVTSLSHYQPSVWIITLYFNVDLLFHNPQQPTLWLCRLPPFSSQLLQSQTSVRKSLKFTDGKVCKFFILKPVIQHTHQSLMSLVHPVVKVANIVVTQVNH